MFINGSVESFLEAKNIKKHISPLLSVAFITRNNHSSDFC